jgi:hypothetical protein
MSNSSQQNLYSDISISDDSIGTITIDIPYDPASSIWTNATTISSIDSYPYNGTYSGVFTVKGSDGSEIITVPPGEGVVKVNGDIVLNGDSLNERLTRIETMLNIPTRDVKIEEQFPRLRKIYEEYMQELEKYKTWARLTK